MGLNGGDSDGGYKDDDDSLGFYEILFRSIYPTFFTELTVKKISCYSSPYCESFLKTNVEKSPLSSNLIHCGEAPVSSLNSNSILFNPY